MIVLQILLQIVLALFVFNLPSLVAIARLHNNARQIMAVNFIFGVTVVGWFWALKMAFENPNKEYA